MTIGDKIKDEKLQYDSNKNISIIIRYETKKYIFDLLISK